MTAVLAALSLSDRIEQYGAYAGIAAIVGIGVLSLLYIAQAREVKRLREWAGRAPERDADLQQRVVAEAQRRTTAGPRPAPAPAGKSVPPPLAAKPATPAAQATAPPATAKPAAGTPPAPGAPAVPVPAAATAAAAAAAGAAAPAAGPAGGEPAPAGPPAPARATPPPPAPATAPPAAAKPAPPAPEPAPAAAKPAPPAPERAPAAAKPAPPAPPASGAAAAGPAPAGQPAPATPAAGRASEPPAARPAPPPPAPRPRPAAAPLRAGTSEATIPPRATEGPATPGGSRRALLGVVLGGLAIIAVAAVLITQVLSGDEEPVTTTPNTVETAGGGTADGQAPIDRAATRVAVLNGTTVTGLARGAADKLQAGGYKDVSPVTTDTSNQARATTVVYYEQDARRQARDVARLVGVGDGALEAMDQNARVLGGNAPVVVIVGADQAQ